MLPTNRVLNEHVFVEIFNSLFIFCLSQMLYGSQEGDVATKCGHFVIIPCEEVLLL